MDNCNISEIEKYTVALYREKYSQPAHIGSGILMRIQDKYYLVSAYHVFNMEEERLRIENDHDEEGIPQDDMDGIMARTDEGYFFINSKMTGVVFTAKYDPETKQAVFNEDTEWCRCELTTEIANIFIRDGKSFYDGNLIESFEEEGIKEEAINMIISGFPKYAQYKDVEQYRSFKADNTITDQSFDKSLIRVGFVNNKAFNCEQNRDIELPPYGIAGMSGGGIWAYKDEKFMPIGIILKQDPTENYVEGFRMDCILKSIKEADKKINRYMNKLINFLAFVCLGIIFCGQTAHAESKRALLVGISDYGNSTEDPNKWANISGANDITLLTPLFKEQGFDITSLVDGQATHVGIVKALDKLAKNSKKGDVVYVHFSMHGQPFEDLNGDEDDGWDEALIPVDAEMIYTEGGYDGKNHLLDDELEVYFNNIRSKIGPDGHLYVILDACHSGTASRGDDDHIRGTREGFTRSGKEYVPDRTQETNDYFQVPTSEGQSPVTFIEACRSYQVNREVRDVDTNTWYGSVSYYIAQAMKEHQIGATEEWIESVKTGMGNNRRLRKQNIVIETSK